MGHFRASILHISIIRPSCSVAPYLACLPCFDLEMDS